jgi:hypothetical protein
MGRFVFALVVIGGLGYGGWSLFGPEEDQTALSTVTGSGGGAPTEGGKEAAGKQEPAKAPMVTDEERTKLLEAAGAHLAAAEVAKTRGAALAEKDKARRLISKVLIECPGEQAELLRKKVDALNEDVLFSEEPLAGTSFLYTIQPNDSLWQLCYRTFPKQQQIRVEPGFVLWVNGLSDPTRIREGQIVKVPKEEVSLLVKKSSRKLWVLLGGVYLREFSVGIGAKDKTPEGQFEIETKIEKPDWYFDGKKIKFGSPENPLGTRWMGFKRTRRAAGYGIHGTDEPETVGKAASEGCVRMLNEEVEELFGWVPRGTKVTIVR